MRRRWSTKEDLTLAGTRILVVEDEVLLALELEQALSDEGAEIVGPCYTVGEAQNLAATAELTAAVLDVELGQDMIAPVARTLSGRGVPFIFHTGRNDIEVLIRQWPGCRVVRKPASPQAVVAAVAGVLSR